MMLAEHQGTTIERSMASHEKEIKEMDRGDEGDECYIYVHEDVSPIFENLYFTTNAAQGRKKLRRTEGLGEIWGESNQP
jgi:hypothetical protein